METIGPHVRTLPVRCAPRKAPRPTCGNWGNRLPFRSLARDTPI